MIRHYACLQVTTRIHFTWVAVGCVCFFLCVFFLGVGGGGSGGRWCLGVVAC